MKSAKVLSKINVMGMTSLALSSSIFDIKPKEHQVIINGSKYPFSIGYGTGGRMIVIENCPEENIEEVYFPG